MESITVVVACDNNYLVLLSALINSIEKNLRHGISINLWIIEDNISESNKNKLQSSVNGLITKLHWQSMLNVIPDGMELPIDRSSYPLNIYMRLFIPYFIPKEIEKVLYLDVDMIVQKDISVLFEINLDDFLLGAVKDPRIISFDNTWGGVLNYTELGIEGQTKYFNTGLLLIPTNKWIEYNITYKILKCIDANKKFANYPDQYGMNVVLANQWLELDSRWNHFSTIEHHDPYLIHFVQRKPIFKSYNNSVIFQKIFYEYLSNTEWKNEKQRGETGRYLKKINNIIEKLVKLIFH